MDAAQRLLKNSAILAATALLMATVGLAQPTLNVATSVTMAGTGGQDVSVTSSGSPTTEITYAIGAPSYAADGGGSWLGVPSGSQTTPASLSFSLARAPLTGGAHVATVTLTPTSPANAAAVTITVTYNSGSSGGGGATVLSASPTTVSLTAGANSQASYPVAITTTSASAITISMTASVTGSVTNWLSNSTLATNTISSSGGTTLTIVANSSNLATGSYQGTVTITPSTGLPLNITVNFTVGSTVGNGTWYATPGSVAWNFTSNSGSYPSQAVSISTTSGSATYSATTSANENNWLQVYTAYNGSSNGISGIAVGTQLGLTVDSQVNSLSTGAHYGYVYIYDSNGAQQLTITVTITVNGTTSTSLTVTPNPISINVAVNGTQQSQTVSVYSSGGGYLTISASLPSGLTYQLPTNNLVAAGGSTAFTVYANPYGLAANTYSGTLYVYVGSQSAAVPVSMIVGGGNSNTLTVTPNPISLNVAVNGAQQSLAVSVYSGSGGILSITPSLPSGLTYQLPSNTTVAAGGSVVFTVYANPYGLAANTYSGTLYVYVGSQSAAVPVSMIVGGGGTGTTAIAPASLNFAYQIGTDPVNFVARQKLVITGTAGAWSSSVSTADGGTWLKLSPTGGTALPSPADDSQAPIVSIDATGLNAGSYGGTIVINTPGASQSISVSLTVGTTTVLLPTPSGSLVFAAQTGQAKPTGKSIFFSGSDSTLNPLAITVVSNNTWISVTNDATSMFVQVDQTGLTTGVYSGSISVSQTGAANSPTLIPVVLVVNGGGSGGTPPANSNVTVTPTSLTFSTAFASSPAAQTLNVTSTSGSASVSFTVASTTTSGGSWLSTSVTSGATPLNPLTVTVNSNSLASGTYNGNIAISPAGGNPVNIPVILTVGAATAVSATPTTLTFNYSVGSSAPASQPIAVSGSGAAFTAAASSNGNWLVVSPASGTAPGTVNVSVNPSGLAANTYIGTVTVAAASGASGSTTVTVTLNVTTPLPTVTKVTNAASYAIGSLSPGEIITLFANDPTHPIGPATPAGLTLDSTGKVSTTIGGVQVTVNGYNCPMIYASASQVSAVVPYEIKQFVSATVLVKFLGQSSNGVVMNVATTVPGVFTLNASGTGPGAILNSNASTNSPANPATRGDTVVVYLTGEGETSPSGVTGKVTTVASPPQPLTPGPLLQPTVTIGGQPANWSFAGEAPGLVSGVLQLNVTVPTNIAAGDQPIVVSFGGNPSQAGVTVSVK